MTREEVYERLNGVFREVLDDDSIELHDETVADDVDGQDSFEHINLIVGVEEEFGFKIPMGKVVTMKNVGEMVDIILELGKQYVYHIVLFFSAGNGWCIGILRST